MDASVLTKLGEIERAANEILSQIPGKKAELQQAADRRTAEYDRAQAERTRAELASMRTTMQKSLDLRVRRLENDAEARLEMLKRHFEEDRDARVTEILGQILK